MATHLSYRKVSVPPPGPHAVAEMARGTFDMQAIYRSVVINDEASHGCWLHDVDGNVYLDLFSSFALGALGYNHPAMLEMARSPRFAYASINPTSTPFLTTGAWFDFLQELERHAPAGAHRVFCVDSGSEGVESALKAAFIVHGERRRAGQGVAPDPLKLSAEDQCAIMDNIGTDAIAVSFSGAFHGRGLGPMSATHSKLIHKADLPAFPWPTAIFPANRWPLERYAEENEQREREALASLEQLLDQHRGKVAAVLVEPIQSEGGDRHASPAFFRGVQQLAQQAGAAFILDEVQTGVAISGTMWAHQQLDLPRPPDLVCFGKKMQFGGFFATEPYSIRQFGRMYQTRNGDRARALLSMTVLQTIQRESLLENVRNTGRTFLEGLAALEQRFPALVSEARGRGFLLAFDLPTPAVRDDFLKRCLAQGVFVTYTGSRSVRIRPHLITTPAQVEEALGVFHNVLHTMSA